jgi:subtilisin family serine protease
MSKLDGSLTHAMAVWHADLDYARSGEYPYLDPDVVRNRKVPVVVTYSGNPAVLQAAGLDTGFNQGDVISGQVALADVERLEAVPAVVSIALVPTPRVLLDSSVKEMRVPWKVPPTTPWPGKGAGVIVAVIDTGIDIFHDSFRKADGTTRILELWDQAATVGGSLPPAAFQQIGKVYSAAQINAGITAGPPFASVDTNGHGTHVAGTAAGNGVQDDRCSKPGRYVGVAPEADLVIVKAIALPTGSTPNVLDAMQWCAQARARHPGNKPVAINCSFGTDSGPHDGTSAMDVWVDGILKPTGAAIPAGLAFVIAAGNSGELEIHESGIVPANGSVTVSFTMPETSLKADQIDIWYTGTAALTVTLTAPPNPALPGTNTIGPVAPGTFTTFPLGLMQISVNSFSTPSTANNKKNLSLTIAAPPPPPPPAKPPAPIAMRSGVWQLKLTETAGVAAGWDAWFNIEHGDGFPTFHLPTDPNGPPPARRRENTVGSPGTSRSAITVANYDDGSGELAPSSSRWIPVTPVGTPAGEVKPTIAAPGEGIAAPRSRDDPDSQSSCCDQKVINKSGTSMASPHVAGLVALMMQKNRALTFEQIRARLQRSARVDGIPAAEVPPVFDPGLNIRANHLWGSGKVNAAAALAEVPAAPGGVGGGSGFILNEAEWGYTPHTIFSRLGEWRTRVGPRPGLMLVAALISEHVDEVLRLIQTNRVVMVAWHRNGGPRLVRHLLYVQPGDLTLMPEVVDGCDVPQLMRNFLPMLQRFGSERLRDDLSRYTSFACLWPGAALQRLDDAALSLAGAS